MLYDNEIKVEMSAKSQNEALARVIVAAFIVPSDPTVSELTDIKTAVSEAVTNAIIHGYESKQGIVSLHCTLSGEMLTIEVNDTGGGIDDIEQAMTPMYTSKPEQERSGLGFTVMQEFMDSVEVFSEKGKGTRVIMTKRITRSNNAQ